MPSPALAGRFAVPVDDADGVAASIGPGGLFVPTDSPAATGAHVEVEFVTPQGEVLSRIVCKVTDGAAVIQTYRGMALEVVSLDRAAQVALKMATTHKVRRIDAGDEHKVDGLGAGYFASAAEGPVVGIDLGTTNSCVAIVEGDTPRVIATKEGYETLPSVLYLSPEGQVLVGHKAAEKMTLEPARVIYGSKRFIGRPFTDKEVAAYGHFFRWTLASDKRGLVAARIDGRVVSLEVVAAAILKQMREMAEKSLGVAVKRAVVTVPAYFGSTQRQAVRTAGKLAGLEVERIVNEPTAGAVAYGYGRGLDSTILVYDLGGGTFDASVLRVKGDQLEVLATDGGPFLGGSDFDDRLTEHALTHIEKTHGVELRHDAIVLQRLRLAAEAAKRELSESPSATMELPFLFGKTNVSFPVTQDLFESLTRDLVDRTMTIVQAVLDAAGVKSSQLDDVIMIGGQSRSPMVRRLLAERFGKQPTRKVHPDHAVALGAALVAGGATQKQQVELTDVLPSSIRKGKRDGTTEVLLPRGKQLPILKVVEVEDNALALYRGEAAAAGDNEPLGAIQLTAGAGAATTGEVTLTVNAEGLLTATTEDPVTGEERELEISLLADRAVQKPKTNDVFFALS